MSQLPTTKNPSEQKPVGQKFHWPTAHCQKHLWANSGAVSWITPLLINSSPEFWSYELELYCRYTQLIEWSGSWENLATNSGIGVRVGIWRLVTPEIFENLRQITWKIGPRNPWNSKFAKIRGVTREWSCSWVGVVCHVQLRSYSGVWVGQR